VALQQNVLPGLGQVVGQRLHQRHHVGGLQRFVGAVFGAEDADRAVDQAVHLSDVLHAALRTRVGQQALEPDAHARQRRAQVMRDGRHQQAATAKGLDQLAGHLVEHA